MTPSDQDAYEAAEWLRHALKQLTYLAIAAGLAGSSAIAPDGQLADERLKRDLDWMSSLLTGELLYYTPRVEALPPPVPPHAISNSTSHTNDNTSPPRANCRVIWTRQDPKTGITKDNVMGEYSLLRAGEAPVVKDDDEAENMILGRWDLPRRKSRGAGDGGKKPVLNG